MGIAFRAMEFAREVHGDQKRKYTNEPYFGHLAEVAGIASTAAIGDLGSRQYLDVVVAVAWLHDCVEDQHVNTIYLENEFGPEVLSGVVWLSDLEIGNRESRKRQSRERLARAPGWVQSIKCADLISNTKSIVMHDPKFAVTYLEEKRLLLEVLTEADPRLLAMAREMVA